MPEFVIKYICCVLIALMLLPQHVISNEYPVKNISTRATERIIEVRYDLLPEKMKGRYTISIEISDDGGYSYNVKPHMIVGDLGRNITPGRNKRIVWMVEREYPGDIDLDRYEFRITAKKQGFNRNILYALLGAVVAGGGTAAYFIFSGDDETGFPDPPGRPD